MTDKTKRDAKALRSVLVEDCAEFPHIVHTMLQQAAVELESLAAQLEQVTRERDAAGEMLHGYCIACKNYEPGKLIREKEVCLECINNLDDEDLEDNWQWRGVEVEG